MTITVAFVPLMMGDWIALKLKLLVALAPIANDTVLGPTVTVGRVMKETWRTT